MLPEGCALRAVGATQIFPKLELIVCPHIPLSFHCVAHLLPNANADSVSWFISLSTLPGTHNQYLITICRRNERWEYPEGAVPPRPGSGWPLCYCSHRSTSASRTCSRVTLAALFGCRTMYVFHLCHVRLLSPRLLSAVREAGHCELNTTSHYPTPISPLKTLVDQTWFWFPSWGLLIPGKSQGVLSAFTRSLQSLPLRF